MRALAQMQRDRRGLPTATACGRASPHVGVLRDPITGGVWASLAAGADVVLALPRRDRRLRRPPGARRGATRTRRLHGRGQGRRAARSTRSSTEPELRATLALALDAADRRRSALPAPARRRPRSGAPTCRPTGWAAVGRARATRRPRAAAYLDAYFDARLAHQRRPRRRQRPRDAVRRRAPRRAGDRLRRADRHGHHARRLPHRRRGSSASPTGSASRAHARRHARAPPTTRRPSAPASGAAIADLFAAVAGARVPVTTLVIGEGGSGGALALASHGPAVDRPRQLLRRDRARGRDRDPQARTRPTRRRRPTSCACARRTCVELGIVRGIAGAEAVEPGI